MKNIQEAAKKISNLFRNKNWFVECRVSPNYEKFHRNRFFKINEMELALTINVKNLKKAKKEILLDKMYGYSIRLIEI